MGVLLPITLMTITCWCQVTAFLLNGPGSFQFPGGDPTHQQQSGIQHSQCVTSQQSCPCPTVFFPRTGCLYCSCLVPPSTAPPSTPSKPQSSTTTTTTTTTTKPQPASSPMTTVAAQSTNPNVTSSVPEYCAMAKNLCQKSCPGGYLVDPADCTYCVCKQDLVSG